MTLAKYEGLPTCRGLNVDGFMNYMKGSKTMNKTVIAASLALIVLSSFRS